MSEHPSRYGLGAVKGFRSYSDGHRYHGPDPARSAEELMRTRGPVSAVARSAILVVLNLVWLLRLADSELAGLTFVVTVVGLVLAGVTRIGPNWIGTSARSWASVAIVTGLVGLVVLAALAVA